MSLTTLTNKRISNTKEFERELKDIHKAIRILNDKQFRLSRDYQIFCWEFRIFDNSIFQNIIPPQISSILHNFPHACTLINLWRLPYLCQKHQPCMFITIYMLMLILVSTPIYYIEHSLGQCSSFGAPKCWEYAPAFKGIGIAMLFISICFIYYYGGILSYIYYMLYESFTYPLPWQYCQIGKKYIERRCETNLPRFTKETCSKIYFNDRGVCRQLRDNKFAGVIDQAEARKHGIFINTSTSQFVKDFLLRNGENNDIMLATPHNSIILFLIVMWVIVFFSLNLKLRNYLPGKSISNIMAVVPYAILGVLLYYSFQSGYQAGYVRLVQPDFSHVLKGSLWRDAATQALLVMSVGLGSNIYVGSFNRFNQHVVQDSIYGLIFVCISSYFIVHIYLDYMGVIGEKLGTPIDKMIDEPILIIILVFGQAAKLFNFPPFFSILVFGTFAIVGTMGLISLSDSAISNIVDRFTFLYNKRNISAAIFCIVMCALQLIYSMPIGLLIMKIFDTTVISWGYLFIVIMECFSIGVVYRTDMFLMDVQSVVGSLSFRRKPWRYFRYFVWMSTLSTTPGILSFCIMLDLITYFTDKPEKNLNLGDITFAIHISGFLICFCLCILPGLTLLPYQAGGLFTKIRSLYRPSKTWKADLPSYRALCTVTEGQFVDSFTLSTIERNKLEKVYKSVGPVKIEDEEIKDVANEAESAIKI